jgi:hypothetical protein
VVRLDGLGLARVQHHGRVFRVAIARDLVASLRRDGGPGELSASCMIFVHAVRDALLSLDIKDLALGLAVAPVPADGVALLGPLLGLLARAVVIVILLLFILFLVFILIVFLVVAILFLGISILFTVGFRLSFGRLLLLVGAGLASGSLLPFITCVFVLLLILLLLFFLLPLLLIITYSFLRIVIIILGFLLVIVLLTLLLQEVMAPILQRRVRLGLLDLLRRLLTVGLLLLCQMPFATASLAS